MKTILTSLLVCLIGCALYGQDTLITNRGRMYIGRIISQDSTDIKFYRIKDGTALEMTFKKSDLYRIGSESQKSASVKKPFDGWIAEKGTLGLGIGLDYGFVGINITAYPQNNIGFTLGLGNAFAGLGYNFGIKLRKNPQNSRIPIIPYATVIYGVHTSIKVSGSAYLSRLFHGFSVGGGIDIRLSKKSWNSFSLGILAPIRQTEVDQYILELENKGVEFRNKLTPIVASIGFKFGF
jgi:hypothetical protein